MLGGKVAGRGLVSRGRGLVAGLTAVAVELVVAAGGSTEAQVSLAVGTVGAFQEALPSLSASGCALRDGAAGYLFTVKLQLLCMRCEA